jgi:ABC-type polar amino acid transport system ATPase subunit
MSAALFIRGLHAARGGRPVLAGVDLEVAPGEVCALMGVSGAGKSTVLRAVAALEPFTGGSIAAAGFELRPGPLPRESRLRGLRSKVGMVFQAHALFEHLTALQNVTLAPVHALGWTRAKAEEGAMELLAALGGRARRQLPAPAFWRRGAAGGHCAGAGARPHGAADGRAHLRA